MKCDELAHDTSPYYDINALLQPHIWDAVKLGVQAVATRKFSIQYCNFSTLQLYITKI